MNSSSARVWRLFRKELVTEFRSPTNLWTSLIFNVAGATAIGLAANRELPGKELAAGMLIALLMFSSVSVLPRLILAEGDQGTFEFLRLHFEPEEIFLGKLAYAFCVQVVSALIVGTVFVGLCGTPVLNPLFFGLGLVLESLCFAGTMVLCGCFALGAAARWTLAGMLALPLLLPQAIAGQGVFRYAFGAGLVGTAWINVAALAGYVMVLLAVGPGLCRVLSPARSGK